MGKRGPQPKPTALKLLEGTYRKDRAPKNEPKPKVQAPSCPSWLRPEAKAEWKRLAPELVGDGLLTKRDRMLLAALCDAWADFHECEKVIKEDGLTYITGGGILANHPLIVTKHKARDQINKFGAKFGLSPTDRCQMEKPVDESKEAAEARAFLRR